MSVLQVDQVERLLAPPVDHEAHVPHCVWEEEVVDGPEGVVVAPVDQGVLRAEVEVAAVRPPPVRGGDACRALWGLCDYFFKQMK